VNSEPRRYRVDCTFIVRGNPTTTTRRWLCSAPLIRDREQEVHDLVLGCPIGCPAYRNRVGLVPDDGVESNRAVEPPRR